MVPVSGRRRAPPAEDIEVLTTVPSACESLGALCHGEVSPRVLLDRATVGAADHRNGDSERGSADQKCVVHEQVDGDEM